VLGLGTSTLRDKKNCFANWGETTRGSGKFRSIRGKILWVIRELDYPRRERQATLPVGRLYATRGRKRWITEST